MRCPSCQALADTVTDSRENTDGTAIRRRRECSSCRTRFTTYETTTHPTFLDDHRAHAQVVAAHLREFADVLDRWGRVDPPADPEDEP